MEFTEHNDLTLCIKCNVQNLNEKKTPASTTDEEKSECPPENMVGK